MKAKAAVAHRLAAVTMIGLAACTDGPVAPTAEPTRAPLSGPNVVRLAARPDFVEERRELVRGELSRRGSCGLRRRHEVAFGTAAGKTIAERVAAYDPDTCRYEIAIGRLEGGDPAGDGPAAAQHGQPDYAEETTDYYVSQSQPVATTPTTKNAFAQALPYAFLQLWHEDPPGLNVTEQKMELWWETAGTCVYWGRSHGFWRWWTITGWLKEGIMDDLNYSWDHCSAVSYVASSTFHNNMFCSAYKGEYNLHDYTEYTGEIEGRTSSMVFEWYGNAWGDCEDMLTAYVLYGSNL